MNLGMVKDDVKHNFAVVFNVGHTELQNYGKLVKLLAEQSTAEESFNCKRKCIVEAYAFLIRHAVIVVR